MASRSPFFCPVLHLRVGKRSCFSPTAGATSALGWSGLLWSCCPPCQPSSTLSLGREIKALSSASGSPNKQGNVPPWAGTLDPPNGDACVGAAVSAILAHELTSRALTAAGTHTNAPLCPLSHLPLLLLGPDARRTMALSKPRFTAGKGGGEARTRVGSRKEKGLGSGGIAALRGSGQGEMGAGEIWEGLEEGEGADRRRSQKEGGRRKKRVQEGGWGSLTSSVWSRLPFSARLLEGHALALLLCRVVLSFGSSSALGCLATHLVFPRTWERGCYLYTGSYHLSTKRSGVATGRKGCCEPETGHVKHLGTLPGLSQGTFVRSILCTQAKKMWACVRAEGGFPGDVGLLLPWHWAAAHRCFGCTL